MLFSFSNFISFLPSLTMSFISVSKNISFPSTIEALLSILKQLNREDCLGVSYIFLMDFDLDGRVFSLK